MAVNDIFIITTFAGRSQDCFWLLFCALLQVYCWSRPPVHAVVCALDRVHARNVRNTNEWRYLHNEIVDCSPESLCRMFMLMGECYRLPGQISGGVRLWLRPARLMFKVSSKRPREIHEPVLIFYSLVLLCVVLVTVVNKRGHSFFFYPLLQFFLIFHKYLMR